MFERTRSMFIGGLFQREASSDSAAIRLFSAENLQNLRNGAR